MNHHQPHTAKQADREPRELGLIEQILQVFNETARMQSEQHGRRISEGKARAKARREAEARARAATSGADQASE
ncbi:hypothetical protein GCM10010459_00180 [Microbacterium schleiferi]